MICSFANIDQSKVTELQSLEKKMGKVLIAYSCANISPATLTADEMSLLQDLEKKLGLVICAVEG